LAGAQRAVFHNCAAGTLSQPNAWSLGPREIRHARIVGRIEEAADIKLRKVTDGIH